MSAPEALAIDKSRWTPGPWDDEPDRVEWRTAAGLPAIVLRHNKLGHLCGYVAVNPGHPAYGRSYEREYEKDEQGEEDYSREIPNPVLDDVSVHWGITYAEKCFGQVCHIPDPGETDDVWWLGFDACHCEDWGPTDGNYGKPWATRNYRTIDYMRAECESLAAQLVEMVTP